MMKRTIIMPNQGLLLQGVTFTRLCALLYYNDNLRVEWDAVMDFGDYCDTTL